MTTVEQHLPTRELEHSNDTKEVAAPDMEPESYKTSTAPSDVAPRSIYSPKDDDESYDDAMLNEFYDGVLVEDHKKSCDIQAEDAPALPARSTLRASRLLDAFDMKLGHAETTTLSRATPQEVYLSSEEDASSSADEFSDYDFESDSEDSEKSSSRKSHEDTAKVISVVFVGKPSIIDLPATRRSPSPESLQGPTRINTSATEPTLSRRLSVSSSSTAMSTQTAPSPPRSSTIANLPSKKRPSFLSIDPYAGKSYQDSLDENQDEPLATPKTPTALFKRGMSMMRKRSKPHLRDSFNASRDSLSIRSSTALTVEVDEKPAGEPVPVTYNDIVKVAKKKARDSLSTAPASPAVQSPATPNGKSRILSSFHRRRSIKV